MFFILGFRQNFLRLKNLVLVGGPDDGVITPWESRSVPFFSCKNLILFVYKVWQKSLTTFLSLPFWFERIEDMYPEFNCLIFRKICYYLLIHFINYLFLALVILGLMWCSKIAFRVVEWEGVCVLQVQIGSCLDVDREYYWQCTTLYIIYLYPSPPYGWHQGWWSWSWLCLK